MLFFFFKKRGVKKTKSFFFKEKKILQGSCLEVAFPGAFGENCYEVCEPVSA